MHKFFFLFISILPSSSPQAPAALKVVLSATHSYGGMVKMKNFSYVLCLLVTPFSVPVFFAQIGEEGGNSEPSHILSQ